MIIQTTIGEFCPFEYGKGLSVNKRLSGNIPVYGSNGIVGVHNEPYVPTHGIIIGRKGSVGALQISDRPFWPIDTSFYVVKDDYFETVYTFYLLKSLGLDGMNSDSAVPGLNRNNAHALKVNILGTSEERKATGRLIARFDDKIENNRQMNQTLEEMARAIFKSWFVDFDPVHAKAAGNAPAHMDAETAALFPNSFGDDGLPVSWSVGKIEDIVDRQRAGKLFSKKTVNEEGKVPVLDQSADDIIGYHNEHPSVLASPTDRVITFANHTCVLRLIDFNFSAIQNVIPFKGKKYPTEWVLFASHNKQKFEEYKGHWPTFMVQPVIMPDDGTSSAFAKWIEPMVSKISANISQNKTLAELRDTLLPKLMSGEISVKDAEGEVEAAV